MLGMVTVPVPLKATFTVGAFEGILRLALFAPDDAGEKIACTVQVADEVKVFPEQLSFSLPYSEAFVPVRVIVPITRPAPRCL